jgi:hypothetical protein
MNDSLSHLYKLGDDDCIFEEGDFSGFIWNFEARSMLFDILIDDVKGLLIELIDKTHQIELLLDVWNLRQFIKFVAFDIEVIVLDNLSTLARGEPHEVANYLLFFHYYKGGKHQVRLVILTSNHLIFILFKIYCKADYGLF